MEREKEPTEEQKKDSLVITFILVCYQQARIYVRYHINVFASDVDSFIRISSSVFVDHSSPSLTSIL